MKPINDYTEAEWLDMDRRIHEWVWIKTPSRPIEYFYDEVLYHTDLNLCAGFESKLRGDDIDADDELERAVIYDDSGMSSYRLEYITEVAKQFPIAMRNGLIDVSNLSYPCIQEFLFASPKHRVLAMCKVLDEMGE